MGRLNIVKTRILLQISLQIHCNVIKNPINIIHEIQSPPYKHHLKWEIF